MAVDIAKGPSDGFLEYAMILDSKFTMIDILDSFETFYWNERYNAYGDFEITMPILVNHLEFIRINNYISIKESDRLMIIEDVTTTTDPEQGDKLVVSGRSLDSLLTRRIVWKKAELSGSIQTIIQSLLNQNVISPTDSRRRLPGFTFTPSSENSVTKPTGEVKAFGDGLYETIAGLCQANNLGFKVLPSEEGGFTMSLYAGIDRSWKQEERVPVVFSHSYENLLDSRYIQTEVEYISNALVRGDDDDVTMEVLRRPERTGLARREMFIDTGLQPEEQEIEKEVTDDGGNTHTDTERIKIYDMAYYNAMLLEAKVEMAKHTVTEAFDSEVDTTHQFFYEKDYNLGDIVQVENRYGFEGRCRITEVMRSRDVNGPKLVPTFVMVDENGDEVVRN